MIKLTPMTESDIEWIRIQRNKPEQYKYFRQDRPITENEQKKWWRTLQHNRVRLFIVLDSAGARIGYVGFNPFDQYAKKGEFGVFIVEEEQHKGYGAMALKQLFDMGFTKFNLSTIYSDMLDYPGEDRWAFYEGMGFEKYPPPCQHLYYMKQGKRIPSIRFYITKEMWEKWNAKQPGVDADKLELAAANEAAPSVVVKERKRLGRPPGKANLNKAPRKNLRAN